jgi:hypothetical protein
MYTSKHVGTCYVVIWSFCTPSVIWWLSWNFYGLCMLIWCDLVAYVFLCCPFFCQNLMQYMSKYGKIFQSVVHFLSKSDAIYVKIWKNVSKCRPFFCQNRGKIAKNSKLRLNSQGQFCLFLANLTPLTPLHRTRA